MSQKNNDEESVEKKVSPGGTTDPVTNRCKQILREGQVCLVEIPTQGETELGTGFLIGPSAILTNWHGEPEGAIPSGDSTKLIFSFHPLAVLIRSAKMTQCRFY